MKNNDIKKQPLNSLIDIDKKILPFFSSPIILKRISDQKKNKNLNLLNPQKKLIYKIIKLNENLVKFSTSIKIYNLNLDSFFLSNQYANSQHVVHKDSASLTIPAKPFQAEIESLGLGAEQDRDNKLNINVGNKSEFILFIRNKLYYNLKYRLSNILYKVERFTPIFKFHSLLNNINLFVPKRLFKPQPYMRFTYRMMRINNNFKNISSLAITPPHTLHMEMEGERVLEFNSTTSPAAALIDQEDDWYKSILPLLKASKLKKNIQNTTTVTSQLNLNLNGQDLFNLGRDLDKPHSLFTNTPLTRNLQKGGRVKVLIKINNYDDHSSLNIVPGLSTVNNTSTSDPTDKSSAANTPLKGRERTVGIGITNIKDYSTIQLHKFENGRSIKYILLKLNNLLNEIENMINIKNKLINSIKVKNIKNLSNFESSDLVQEDSFTSNKSNLQHTNKVIETYASDAALYSQLTEEASNANQTHSQTHPHLFREPQAQNLSLFTKGKEKEVALPPILLGQRPTQEHQSQKHSDQSVKNLRLKIKKINSHNSINNNNNNKNLETYPLLVEAGMVKENIIKIDQASITIPSLTYGAYDTNLASYKQPNLTEGNVVTKEGLHHSLARTEGTVGVGQLAWSATCPTAEQQPEQCLISAGFDTKKDIINENSNPVDLLYFNNNLKKPIINQYLKSMSTYNMITNGTILYYSNIIGFNFKKRIRVYLPFIKSINVAKLKDSASQVSLLQMEGKTLLRSQVLPTTSQTQGGTSPTLGAGGKLPVQSIQHTPSKMGQAKPIHLKNVALTHSPSPTVEAGIRYSERLTSPYTFRGISKVVGTLDKGKFSVFGRGIENNKLINNIYKFLFLSFKSMYCLISKPVFIVKSNKIIIQLFYFLIIPKIFKHIKSNTNYKPRNKKKVYHEFLKKKLKIALATLFEDRFKVKEDALKIKHFSQLGSMDTKLHQRLKIETYYKEWLELRNIEEKFSGVKIDNFGKVIFKSLEEKYIKIKKNSKLPFFLSLMEERFKRRKDNRVNAWALTSKKISKKKNNRNNIKKNWIFKTFFKRFEFNKINNGHILRIPRKFLNAKKLKYPNPKFFKYLALTYLNIFKFKVGHPILNRMKLKLRGFQKDIIREKSYLLYENNLGLKVNKIGKEGNTVEKATLLNSDKQNLPLLHPNKFKSYNKNKNKNKINWFLFKKLFWSIRMSKKIIPNAKILQKLGIPQWCWPYISIKKKGYSYTDETKGYNLPIFNYNSPLTNIIYNQFRPTLELKGVSSNPSYGAYGSLVLKEGGEEGHGTLSLVGQKRWEVLQPLRSREGGVPSSFINWESSWPFSFLMPTAFKQKLKQKKVNHSNVNFEVKLNKEGWVVPGSMANIGLQKAPIRNLRENLPLSISELSSLPTVPASLPSVPSVPTELKGKGWEPTVPKTKSNKKQSRYRITELDTRRYHLMKLANINLIKIYPLKFEKLCEVLNSIFNKPVELDLIRLHYPYNDSNILVRLLAIMINKLKVRRITRRLFNKAVVKSIKKVNNNDQVNIIPAFLSGITIKVAGRLMKYKVIPRKTVRFVRRGSSSIGKVNFSDISRYTNKNKRGSFSITINSGQNFF